MTGATEDTDYTVEYHTSGDFSGSTVLTMLGGTAAPAGTVIMFR